MSFKEKIDILNLPKHVAIIMDGNGRWAQQKSEQRIFGHQHGVESVRDCVEACAEIGVKYLTLYAFSTENWNRPKEEVDALMELLVSTIASETPTLNKNNIRLLAIGDLKSLPGKCYTQLQQAMHETANNTRTTLVLALSYSSRWEIVNAVKQIAFEVESGRLSSDEINDKIFEQHLNTAELGIPDPELLIRTSGERRVSNYLLWQIAYAEMYFTDVLWPDFRKENLFEAIYDFQNRERRFGLTSEQINTQKQ
ncbi:MAG: isoprenyl transferase [Bacteroidota bacterium]